MPLFGFLRDNVRFLGSGAILSFSSSYGQTYFIAIFAAQIMHFYGLTDGEWGVLYTVSTTASAIVMFWAGALTDHFRVRTLAIVVMPALGLTCFAMAGSSWLWSLVVVVFFLRLFGQGMMSQLAVTAMARWFSARRGLALSISAMGFSLGQAVLPVLVASLLLIMDWRAIWLGTGLVVLATLPIILTLLSKERTPQSLATSSTSLGMDGRHWTRSDVLKSSFFWLLMPMLLGPPAWGTALFFQQVHIAEVKGWPLVDYLALIPLMTVIGVGSTLLSGQFIDRFGTARMAPIYLLPFAAAFLMLAFADSLIAAAIALSIFGLGHGMQATLPAAFWAEFFGTRHIGAIKAVSTSIMVFGSAIGPGITGVLIDLGYDFPQQMVAIAAYFVLAAALVWFAVSRAASRLPAPEVDIKGA